MVKSKRLPRTRNGKKLVGASGFGNKLFDKRKIKLDFE